MGREGLRAHLPHAASPFIRVSAVRLVWPFSPFPQSIVIVIIAPQAVHGHRAAESFAPALDPEPIPSKDWKASEEVGGSKARLGLQSHYSIPSPAARHPMPLRCCTYTPETDRTLDLSGRSVFIKERRAHITISLCCLGWKCLPAARSVLSRRQPKFVNPPLAQSPVPRRGIPRPSLAARPAS